MTDIMLEAARQAAKSPNRYAHDQSSNAGIGLSRFMLFFWYVVATNRGGSSGRTFFRHGSAVKYFERMKTKYGLKE